MMKAWIGGATLGVGLSWFGCTAHQQTVAELESALVSLMPAEQGSEWLRALRAAPPARRSLVPPTGIVVAWVPPRPVEGVESPRVSIAARERWMTTIREKLERAGLAARVDVTAAGFFDDGVSLDRVGTAAKQREADLVVLFTVESTRRRYNTFSPDPTRTGDVSRVTTVVEVVSTARAVGVAPAGYPLFAASKLGADSETGLMRSADEVEEVANRVAIEEIGDSIVLDVDRIFYGGNGGAR